MKYLFIIYTWEGHSWFYHKFKTTKFYHELMNRDDIEVVKFQLPTEDYSQLPMKTYKMLEWAMDYDFDYLIKCDVNTFCNPRIMYLPTWDVEKVCSDESDYWGVYLCRTRWHELESWKEVKGFSDYPIEKFIKDNNLTRVHYEGKCYRLSRDNCQKVLDKGIDFVKWFNESVPGMEDLMVGNIVRNRI